LPDGNGESQVRRLTGAYPITAVLDSNNPLSWTDIKIGLNMNLTGLNNYYTKTEVDNNLELKANQSTTYTKTEVNTSLASKHNNLLYPNTDGNTSWGAIDRSTNNVRTLVGVSPIQTYIELDVNNPITSINEIKLGFDKSLTGLTNYYTKTEVDAKIAAINPFHIAAKVNANATIAFNHGKSGFTVTREPGNPVGVYRITMTTPHPRGANYGIHTDAHFWGTIRIWENFTNTSTQFVVTCFATNTVDLVNGAFFVSVLA